MSKSSFLERWIPRNECLFCPRATNRANRLVLRLIDVITELPSVANIVSILLLTFIAWLSWWLYRRLKTIRRVSITGLTSIYKYHVKRLNNQQKLSRVYNTCLIYIKLKIEFLFSFSLKKEINTKLKQSFL